MSDTQRKDICPHCAMPVHFKQKSIGRWSARLAGAGTGAYAASGLTITGVAILGFPIAAIVSSALGWYVGDNFGGDIDKRESNCPICDRKLGRSDW